jgi:hypothetical protein
MYSTALTTIKREDLRENNNAGVHQGDHVEMPILRGIASNLMCPI